MVDRGCTRVEEHGNRTDELGDEDGQDGLPVVEADTDQTRTQGPVTKRQGEVEDNIVVPYTSIRHPYSGMSKGYLHLQVRFSGGVGSRSSFDHVGPVSPCEWRSSAVSGTRTHCLKLSQLLKALTAFFFFSMAEAFAVEKVMVGRSLRRLSWERARMQAQAVLYLCSVPYLIATAIAATRQKEGEEGEKNPEQPKVKSTRLWADGFRAGFSYNFNSDKSSYCCTCRF